MERKDWKLDLRVNENTELEMFEDLAWLMARHADPANVPDSPEEFLDQFNTCSRSGRTTTIRTKNWYLNTTWMSSDRKL